MKMTIYLMSMFVFSTIRDVVQKCGDTLNIRVSDFKITLTEATNTDMWHLIV